MIVCDHVSKYYGQHAAVADMHLHIAEGEVVGLLGLNGAGKTTLLRILSGLVVPSCGRVEIAGRNMADDPMAVRSHLGFAAERPPLYGDMTVAAYLRFVARLKGMRGNIDAALHRALMATDLEEVQHDIIDTLSSGYQRRVGIAQAIVHAPELILLDEPTSGLDPVQIVHMRRLIRALRGKNTIVVSSHQLSEIHALCDRILVLQEGRMVAEGSEAELARKVGESYTFSLVVRGSITDLQQVLQPLAFVRAVQIERADAGTVEATITLNSDAAEQVAEALVHAGLGLRRLQRLTVALENIFMRLTGGTPPA